MVWMRGGGVGGLGWLGRATYELEGDRLLGVVSRPCDLTGGGNRVQPEVQG